MKKLGFPKRIFTTVTDTSMFMFRRFLSLGEMVVQFRMFSNMKSVMDGVGQKLKVLNPIINSVTIYMVNMFSFFKFSPKFFLHKVMMIKLLSYNSSSNVDSNISLSSMREPSFPKRTIFSRWSNHMTPIYMISLSLVPRLMAFFETTFIHRYKYFNITG